MPQRIPAEKLPSQSARFLTVIYSGKMKFRFPKRGVTDA